MKRSIARAWAKALESGDYQQTAGSLREGNSFCCLGVLCNMHAEAFPQVAAEEVYERLYLGHDCDLPEEVLEWSGMKDSEGRFDTTQGWDTLITLNDERGLTFPEIAKVIRKHWKEL